MKKLNTPYVIELRNKHLGHAGGQMVFGFAMLLFVSLALAMCSANAYFHVANLLISLYLIYRSYVNFKLSEKYEGYLKKYLSASEYYNAERQFTHLGF